MSEPILSREEVDRIRLSCIENTIGFDHEKFAREIEAALLEKLRGEPDAWMVLAANTRQPCEVTLHKSETEALRQDCVIPLYTLKGQS
ncbi:hypothetical protein [Burkholderia multivorans]|uniref:hypothetical protein n=1 Tax=Burkholderia multivorans TaxID=87883 RepID=UPI00066610BB|nr:hypothetical protein [Burkholderia multivorans]